MRTRWPAVIDVAREWVVSQPFLVTLRQCFYALIAAQVIENTTTAYKRLSGLTAEGRRDGSFPALADGTRSIEVERSWADESQFLEQVESWFRLDRQDGQRWTIVLGVEKRGLVDQVRRAYGEPFGIPVVGLGGYGSQTIKDDVADLIERARRPSVLLYVGDYDPSGLDIERDVLARVPFDKHVRVALTAAQIEEFGLPAAPAKTTDSRSVAMARTQGAAMQVEVDALPPLTLAGLIGAALDEFLDLSAFDEVLDRERDLRVVLHDLIARDGHR